MDTRETGIDAAIGRAIRVIELALAWVLLGAIVLNFANVIGRYVFARTIFGADEVQIYGMIWIAFLGAAVVTWRGEHLRMDVLLQRFPIGVTRALRIIELLVVIVLAGFVVVVSTRYAQSMLDVKSSLGGIPMWIPHLAVAVGYLLIGLLCLRLLGTGRKP